MQYVNTNRKQVFKKYEKIHNYNFNFLDIINNFLPIDIIYHYLNHLIEYKLKNVWNSIVINWIQVNTKMKKRNKKKYINSFYSKESPKHIHRIINYSELNDLLNNFINKDKFKAIFVVISIQNIFHI